MRRGLIYGIFLWALLTFGFKLAVDGDIVALTGADLRMGLPLAGVAFAALTAIVLRVGCSPDKAVRFGLGLAIPGMLLSSATLLAFGRFVARPSMEHGVVYAVFMLWTYGLILSAIALFGDKIAGNGAGYGTFEQTQYKNRHR